jgi:hypothetical protein
MTFFEMFDAAKAGFANADVSGLNGHVAIQIEVTEDGCGIFYAEVTDGVLNVQPYDYRDNTAAVTLPHSTLFALLRRETTLPEAVAQEKAFVQGCMESAAKLFAAVPAPKKAEAPKKEAAPAEEKKPACCKATAAETKKETTCKAAAPVVEEKKEAATTPAKATAPVVEEKKEAAATTAKAAAPVVEEKKEAATATTTTTTAPKTAAAKTVNRKATSKPMTKHNNRRK